MASPRRLPGSTSRLPKSRFINDESSNAAAQPIHYVANQNEVPTSGKRPRALLGPGRCRKGSLRWLQSAGGFMATMKVVVAQMKTAQISGPGADFEIVEREIPEP